MNRARKVKQGVRFFKEDKIQRTFAQKCNLIMIIGSV